MSKVVDINTFRRKKQKEIDWKNNNLPTHIDYPGQIVDNPFHPRSDSIEDYEARMIRIREAVERVNKLVNLLRARHMIQDMARQSFKKEE